MYESIRMRVFRVSGLERSDETEDPANQESKIDDGACWLGHSSISARIMVHIKSE